MADSLKLITVPPVLPEFSGPTQQHHWSLQEKRLELEKDETLSLSTEEFDAFLTSFSIKPSLGYCLHRMRFTAEDESGTFYLLGSGFFMNSLIIQIEVNKINSRVKTGQIYLNSWPVPDTGVISRHVKSLIYGFFKKDYPNLAGDYESGNWRFDFDENNITLSGSILKR